MSITLILIIITVLISLQGFNNHVMFERLKHHPYSEYNHKEYYRLLGGGFLHGSFPHLAINMFVLYEFGRHVEQYFVVDFGETQGRIYYLLFYLLGVIAGGSITHFKHKHNPGFASIGASGAVSAILFAYIYFLPWSWLGLFFVIPIPAIVFAILYLAYSTWAAKNERHGKIDHLGHFGGAVFGLIAIVVLMNYRLGNFIENLLQGPDLSVF